MSMKYRVQNDMKQSKRRAIAYNQAISSIHVMFSTLFRPVLKGCFSSGNHATNFFRVTLKKEHSALEGSFWMPRFIMS